MTTTEVVITGERLVLLIIDEAGREIRGRTLLQKRGYFLSVLLGIDLGYKAHFFGPYSPELERAVGWAKALGFLDERAISLGIGDSAGFELRRYDYLLTDDGKLLVDNLCSLHGSECDKVRGALRRLKSAGDNGDHVSLSVAAKTYYILNQLASAMTVANIRDSAKSLGWKIKEQDVDRAVSFLETLDLVAEA